MSQPSIGIDPAAESFTASIFLDPQTVRTAPQPFPMLLEGIKAFESWVRQQEVRLDRARIYVENTGVYSEMLCYQLRERGYSLALLDPRKIWKAFPDGQPKNDPLDSQKVAEYGFRFADTIENWRPQEELIEQIQILLQTREQLVRQKTATQNSRTTLSRKVIQTPAANRALDATLTHLVEQIRALEAELKRLIRSDPNLRSGVALLMSAPGVGWFLSAQLLVLTRGFTEPPTYRTLAQYIGISPNEHSSGTSVRKRSRSRRYGPAQIRKLLHLAARSLRTHHEPSRNYFFRKLAEGKPKKLVLNNIANQLLKRLCAMLRDQTPYIDTHNSMNPRLLALA